MSVTSFKTFKAVSNKPQKFVHSRFLTIALILGAVMGILFIVFQPLFGMDTLTSRHAAAYQQLGNWSAIPAIIIAWIAHMGVSLFYGLLSGLVFLKTSKLGVVALYTLFFSWLTTVIAPPANALIIQLVALQQINLDKLPGLNFSFDVKFALHLIFFAVISVGLYVYKRRCS